MPDNARYAARVVQARAAIQRSLTVKAESRAFLSEMRRTLAATGDE